MKNYTMIGTIFFSGLIFAQWGLFPTPTNLMIHSQNVKNEIRPLVVLRDANVPSLSHDGRKISVGPEVGLDVVFDVDLGKSLGNFRQTRSLAGVISGNGKQLRVFGGGRHVLYDIESGQQLSEGRTEVYRDLKLAGTVAVAQHSGMLTKNITSDLSVAASFNSPSDYDNPRPEQPAVLIGRLDNNTVVQELRSDDNFIRGDIWEHVSMTPNGRYVSAVRRNLTSVGTGFRTKTAVWDVETGKVILSLPFWSSASTLALADDGSRFVTQRGSDRDNSAIEIWDLRTGKRISAISQKANGRSVRVGAMAISPDGKLLATTLESKFYFWNADTGEYVASQDQKEVSGDSAHTVVFSGDGSRIAVSTYSETVTVWSVEEILRRVKNGGDLGGKSGAGPDVIKMDSRSMDSRLHRVESRKIWGQACNSCNLSFARVGYPCTI